MKLIPLNHGKFAKVDDWHFERIAQFGNWYAIKKKHTWYAACSISCKGGYMQVYMHDLVLPVRTGKMVDHGDRDGLNNQETNLREATQSQNNANSQVSCANTSGFKGVFWSSIHSKWRVQIVRDGVRMFVGCFDDVAHAGFAYNVAAEIVFGTFSRGNDVNLETTVQETIKRIVKQKLLKYGYGVPNGTSDRTGLAEFH